MSHHSEIERRAYELYEQRGRADGHDWDDWLRAERDVGGRKVASEVHASAERGASSLSRRRRDSQSTSALKH